MVMKQILEMVRLVVALVTKRILVEEMVNRTQPQQLEVNRIHQPRPMAVVVTLEEMMAVAPVTLQLHPHRHKVKQQVPQRNILTRMRSV